MPPKGASSSSSAPERGGQEDFRFGSVVFNRGSGGYGGDGEDNRGRIVEEGLRMPPKGASSSSSAPERGGQEDFRFGSVVFNRGSGGYGGDGRGAPTKRSGTQISATAMVPADSEEETKGASSSSTAIKRAPRPGFGILGDAVKVRANHFLVDVYDKGLTEYRVTITPDVKCSAFKRKIIKEVVHVYGASKLKGRIPAYDGGNNIYIAGGPLFRSEEFPVILRDDSTSPSGRRDSEFDVSFGCVGRLDMEHVQKFCKGRWEEVPEEVEIFRALHTVLRESASKITHYTVVGRSFFHPSLGRGRFGDGLEFWKGYHRSLRATQMGLSLNINVSASSFYEPIKVSDFVDKYFNHLGKPLNYEDRIKVTQSLKGVQVQTDHNGYTRKRTINGLSADSLRDLMLVDDGKPISIIRYFERNYRTPLKLTHLPALLVGTSSRPVYLPMELCTIVAGQRFSKNLNRRQVHALLKATCIRPGERESEISKIVENNYSRDSIAKREFGINVKEKLMEIQARILPAPMIKYLDYGNASTAVYPRNGAWTMTDKKMVKGATVDNWACICLSKSMQRKIVEIFCDKLKDMCQSKGMEVNSNPTIEFLREVSDIASDLKHIHEKSQRGQKKLKLLIVILPDDIECYGKIKEIYDTELGIVSQCCRPEKVEKMSSKYIEYLSLKINLKVGGQNHILRDGLLKKISDDPTIIIGADVTHPSTREESDPSIAAVVASMDWPNHTQYRAILSAQKHRVEIIEDLTKMIRDGVGESQFHQVLLHELEAVREACKPLERDYLPPITFVVVVKRHHTRFFLCDRGHSDNIQPGTVVDREICHPEYFDFYLNSHASYLGTSKPTHYHVLFDENKFSADDFQVLTNNLCYTYAKSINAVSIVPPVYYAHLAAFRARYYMSSTSGGSTGTGTAELPAVHDSLKESMFFC